MPDQDAKNPPAIEVTPEMVALGAKMVHEWEDSDEPDARILVRELLEAVLGRRATFC